MVRKKKIPMSNQIEYFTNQMTFYVGTPSSIILHTLFFIGAFCLLLFGVKFDIILLALTTLVSLEAIYLSLFIQMTVNQHTRSLQSVEEDIEDIQEDVEDIQEDVEDVGEDIDKIQEDDLEEETQEAQDARIFSAIEQQLSKLGSDMTTLREEIQSLKHKPVPNGQNQKTI